MPPIGDTRDLKSLIKEYIDQNKVMIFSKTTCPYCQKVSEICGNVNVFFMHVDLNKQVHAFNGHFMSTRILKGRIMSMI